MRNRQPIRTARRKVNRDERERRGLAKAPCVMCIQEHHTAGEKHDPELTAPLCEKHHREIHEQMLCAGVSLQHQPDPTRRVAMALRAMAIYGRNEADAMERMADVLEQSKEQ